VVLVTFRIFVFSRLTKLKKSIGEVKDFNNPVARLTMEGDDEFAVLAASFNNLLDDLEKYKLAIDNSSDHIVITDPDLKIIYANKGAEKLTGYTREEMIGNTPKLWQQEGNLAKIVDTVINKGLPFEAEIENRNKSGEFYPVEAKIVPVLDKNGKTKLIVSVQHDISSARRLKENLIMENQQATQKVQEQTTIIEEKEAQLLGLINSISLGFIMFDMNGKLLFTNPAIERIIGLKINDGSIDSVEELLGKTFALKEKFQTCLLDRRAINVREIAFNNRYLRMSVNPIFSSRELMTLIGVAVLIEDNTEAKNAERSKDEFFSIASHELRTPLTAIRGNTALLKTYRERLDQKEVEAMIEDINSASVRLIGIVNDFLDTSRLETGKMVYKKESINLVELAEEAIKEYQTTGSLKMLYLTFVPPANPIENVIGDKERVKQVFVNLVGNAVKYTDKGGVIISVEKDNGFMKVLITDTGKGIPYDTQAGLFNKFQQQPGGEVYTRDVIHGSGLGLYISKMMVEGMGGKIALEKSAPGVGSTFSFELPIAKEAV
jgi:PAS domain S-box-containing protein